VDRLDRQYWQELAREAVPCGVEPHSMGDSGWQDEADAVAREVAAEVARRDYMDRQRVLLRQVRQRELQRMRAKAKREASIAGRLLFAIFGDKVGG
jgi:hypothetical protein